MGAILAFLDLARRDPGLGDDGRSHLERAAAEGQRVREILRQLLDFSHPARSSPRLVDLGSAAEEVAGLIRAQRRWSGIEVRVEREEGTPPVWADRGAVTQILLNLLCNACDAAGARVLMSVTPTILEAREGEDASAAAGRRRPDGVACRVQDDGPGVAAEDRERIFDPFYTTKDPGEGTGLGLANALRLAQENGGSVDLVEGDHGGTFVLRLPVAAASRSDVEAGVRST
jgi:two-component system NtrC family sensor kinase